MMKPFVSLWLFFCRNGGLIKSWLVSPFCHRSLLSGFVSQEIKARYAGSYAGMAWSVLTPLANMFIYVFVFSVVLKIRLNIEETGTGEFVIYLLSGLIPWMFFAEALGQSTSLLMSKANLITKVSFPVNLLPYVGGLSALVLNGIAFQVFLFYLFFTGFFDYIWFALLLLIPLFFMFTLGLVAILSAISVFFRDMQHIVTLIVSLWFYLTPILYPVSMVPEKYQHWLMLNPVLPFIELFRQILLTHSISTTHGLICLFESLFVFIAGGWFFMKLRPSFADVL